MARKRISRRLTTFYERKQHRDRLVELFNQPDVTPETIDRKVTELAELEGDMVYADLLSTLTHLDLPGEEAKERWQLILTHQRTMSERMQRPVDLRVATLDYFLTVEKRFDNPKIVEIYFFDRTTESAITDGLTELYNFRYFQVCLERELSRGERYEKPVSVVMLDLDGFKPYNDTCGHQAGDEALRSVARILMEGTRSIDVVCRYGGDEFLLLLPEVGTEGAKVVAQRLVERIDAWPFPGEEQLPAGRLTSSAGVASYPEHATAGRELLLDADQALYGVKASGKNRVGLPVRSG